MGRFILMVGRVFAWTSRPPYDWRELLRQMVKVGVNSMPVVLLTAMFTGMVLALQTFTVLCASTPRASSARWSACRWCASSPRCSRG